MKEKVSISSLTAGTRFRFEPNGKVYYITRNYAAKPNNSPASGYIYYKDEDGNKGRIYFVNTAVYVE